MRRSEPSHEADWGKIDSLGGRPLDEFDTHPVAHTTYNQRSIPQFAGWCQCFVVSFGASRPFNAHNQRMPSRSRNRAPASYELDFVHYSSVASRMSELLKRRPRQYNHIVVRAGCGKSTIAPQMPSHQRQTSAESRCRLAIPRRLPVWRAPIGSEGRAKERDEAVDPEEQRSRPLNGPIRPLALGLTTQVSAAFLEGRFSTPALHTIADDLLGRLCLISGKEGFGWSFARWIASEDGSEWAKVWSQIDTSRPCRYTIPASVALRHITPESGAPTPFAGSDSTCSSEGSRSPTTRGRPTVCGSRTGVGWWIMESRRNGAISVTCCRVQCSPSSRILYARSPRSLIGTPGSQRRTRLTTWCARMPRVLWRIPSLALTSGVVASTHRNGSAHRCLVQGALTTTAMTIQRSSASLDYSPIARDWSGHDRDSGPVCGFCSPSGAPRSHR